MRTLLYSLIFISSFVLNAQNQLQFDVDISTPERAVKFKAVGFNTERMFYRIIDNEHNLSEDIFKDMMQVGEQIYRWPGGATANFYHLNKNGYGLSRYEVEFIPDPMVCNFSSTTSDYCLALDTIASRNYIYDFMEFADRYQAEIGKKLKVVWIPNLLTFYIHDSLEIEKLRGVNSLAQLETLYAAGQISAGFRERLLENVQAFQLMSSHPSIELEGIEYGNELYYHEVVTHLKYNPTNAIPKALFLSLKSQYYNVIMPGISRLKLLSNFYNSIVHATQPQIKTALPAAVISHLGGMANLNQIWNEAVRDSLLPSNDGVIHHQYVKITGPLIDPSTAENPGNAGNLADIKDLSDEFLHYKLPRIDAAFDDFFSLSANGKEMWVTEFNMDNGIFDGLLYRWMNTFLHGYFNFEFVLSALDNVNENNSIGYAFQHTYVGSFGDYTYSAYTAEFDGTSFKKIKNTTFQTFSVLGDLIPQALQKVSYTANNDAGLERDNLLLRSYYALPDPYDPVDSGAVYLVFSNKSGQNASIDLGNDLQINGLPAGTDKNAVKAKYVWAPHIYSSSGKTEFNSAAPREVFLVDSIGIDPNAVFTIPSYAYGYIRVPFKRKNILSVLPGNKAVSLEIFPNPSRDKIIIHSPGGTITGNHMEVFNILGELIPVQIFKPSSKEFILDINTLPTGTYFCRTTTTAGTAIGKFVKH